MKSNSKLIQSITTLLAILISLIVIIYASKLLIVGQPVTIFQEGIGTGQPFGPSVVENVRYQPAIIPLIAGLVLLAGLLWKKTMIAWVGLGILVVFSILFLFSSGGAFIPAAGILLVLLLIMYFTREKRAD